MDVSMARPDLMWFALHVVCIPCSASAAEHSWSIESWIHSKPDEGIGWGRSWSIDSLGRI